MHTCLRAWCSHILAACPHFLSLLLSRMCRRREQRKSECRACSGGPWLVALGLLALPLLQLLTALAVLLAASSAFAVASQTKELISIIFNSAALLFVLELDNMTGKLVQERCRTLDGQVSPPLSPRVCVLEHNVWGTCSRGPWSARLLGHVYIALLGTMSLHEVLFATPAVPFIHASTVHQWQAVQACHGNYPNSVTGCGIRGGALVLAPMSTISTYRGDPAGLLTFTVLYGLTVTLLFDPPLPTNCISWCVSAKAVLVGCAALFGAMPLVEHRVQGATKSMQTLLDFLMDAQFASYVYTYMYGLAAILWFALYAIVPWARPCHMRSGGPSKLRQRSSTVSSFADVA